MWNQGELMFINVTWNIVYVFVIANVNLSLFFFLFCWIKLLHCYSWIKFVVRIHRGETTHRPCLYCLWQATMNPVWWVVTLSLQEALHHLHYPREERRKGFVFYCTCDQNMQTLCLTFIKAPLTTLLYVRCINLSHSCQKFIMTS